MAPKITYDRLLKAGIDLFYKKGYPETTIREIGAAVHISNSIIYHYFKNKEEMLFEIIKIASQDLAGILETVKKSDHTDPVECLKQMCKAHMVDWCLKRKKESKIVVFDDNWLSGKFKKENRLQQKRIYSIYKDQLKKIQKMGVLRDNNLTIMTFNIFGAITQSIRWYKERGALSKEEVAEKITDSLLHGIIKE